MMITRVVCQLVLINILLGSSLDPTTPPQVEEEDEDWLRDLPPHPPRLMRSAPHRPDFCFELCREFQADRRGDGFDLCDDIQMSRCLYESPEYVCQYLFLSTTEDGLPGIVYSLNGTDLTDAERSMPLTCREAEAIYDEPLYTDATYNGEIPR